MKYQCYDLGEIRKNPDNYIIIDTEDDIENLSDHALQYSRELNKIKFKNERVICFICPLSMALHKQYEKYFIIKTPENINEG